MKGIIFASLLFALTMAGGAAWASEDDEMRFMQGIVNSVGSNSLVLSEGQRVNLSQATEYFDSQGRPSSIQAIAEGRWLYVEGFIERDGSVTAEKLYSLPGYINKKKRSKYLFMQLP